MKPNTKQFKQLFHLDPEVIFLNHGSFGACPRPVMNVYQDWQYRFERQPVKFIRELEGFYTEAHSVLAAHLHVAAGDVAYVINATHGVNVVAQSLKLQPGDQILTTNHEYGACINAWTFACERSGAELVIQPIPLPVNSLQEIADHFWQGVTERTRVIYLSHITSPTALRLPVEEICRRARQVGILTVIDGAHAPGQLDLNLTEIGADFYVGNCHKWMMSPKGAGFLYTRPDLKHLIRPLIVGHSYYPNRVEPCYPAHVEAIGTRDPSAALSVPAAIEFMEKYQWETVRASCKALLSDAMEQIGLITGLPPVYPIGSDFYSQMAVVPIHPEFTPAEVQEIMLNPYHIEMPLPRWEGFYLMRISVQAYTTPDDLDCLVQAVKELYRVREPV